MGLRVWGLALAAALLLSGCASMLHRSYSSSTPHLDYTLTQDQSILRAESYRGLVDAILYFVGERDSTGTIRLYQYTRPVEADLESARREVLEQTPMGAFAVRDIRFSFSRIVSYYEVQVTLSYSRTADEVAAVRPAVGATAIRQELSRAMAEFRPEVALRISYFNGDEQALLTQALRAYYDTPLAAFGLPSLSVSLYPSTGVQRIAHFTLRWPEERSRLAARSEQLLDHARQLLAQSPPPAGGHSPLELAALLEGVWQFDPTGADDPYAALTGQPATHQGWALGLELLCQLAQVENTLVSSTRQGRPAHWLIVAHQGGYRHLAHTDDGPGLYRDSELAALGFVWNGEHYPVCGPDESEPTS